MRRTRAEAKRKETIGKGGDLILNDLRRKEIE